MANSFRIRWRRLPVATALGGLLAVAWHLKHPLLYWRRPYETGLLRAVAVLRSSAARRWPPRHSSAVSRRLPVVGLLVSAGLTLYRELDFETDRQSILAGSSEM